MEQNTEKKKKKKGGPLFIIILIVAIGVFIFAGINLLKIGNRYKEASDSYEAVAGMLDANPDYTEDGTGEEAEDLVPFLWNFDRLKAVNPDTKGWIYEKDLLNYPIVQTDNNDHYLHTTFSGESNPSGCLFIDSMMPKGLNGKYCIVYGHNMNDASMFGCLQKFHQDTDFYKKHPTMHIFIGPKHYIYNVVAAYKADVSGFTYYDALNNEDVTDFIEKARKESIYPMYTGEVTDVTPIIVLSTCTELSEDQYRFVVILSRDHEVKYK